MYKDRSGLILPDNVTTKAEQRRMQAFQVLNSGYSHYGARRRGANIDGWNSYSGSAKEDIEDNLDVLRQRSRDAYMGVPSATAALKTLRTNVVAGGLKPSPQVDADFLGLPPEQAEQLQLIISREFGLWAKTTNCDADRKDNFYGLQQLAYLGQLMNGDSFAVLQNKPRPGSLYDLRVRVIEGDRVCSPWGMDRTTPTVVEGHQVGSLVQGVESTEDGEVCAYWICNRHPRAYTDTHVMKWQRVEAYGSSGQRNILHMMSRERADQRRGVPLLAPVLESMKQLERYADAETTAALLGAIFTVFVQKGSVSDDTPFGQLMQREMQKAADEQPESALSLGAGLIMDLNVGETVNTVEPQHPHAGYDTFMMARMKQVGAALEIPVEVLLKEFNSNFSSSRGALNEFWRTCSMQREWFADDFCQPVYERWFLEAAARGRIPVTPAFFDDPSVFRAYTACAWNGPSRTALNPEQEVNAAIARVNAGFSTAADEAAQMTGSDWNRNIRVRMQEAVRKKAVNDILEPDEPTEKEEAEE